MHMQYWYVHSNRVQWNLHDFEVEMVFSKAKKSVALIVPRGKQGSRFSSIRHVFVSCNGGMMTSQRGGTHTGKASAKGHRKSTTSGDAQDAPLCEGGSS